MADLDGAAWVPGDWDAGPLGDVPVSDNTAVVADFPTPDDIPLFDAVSNILIEARAPIYHQRVFDVGGDQWVYYTKPTIDPTPIASETTPNHTGGSLINHSILLKIFD